MQNKWQFFFEKFPPKSRSEFAGDSRGVFRLAIRYCIHRKWYQKTRCDRNGCVVLICMICAFYSAMEKSVHRWDLLIFVDVFVKNTNRLRLISSISDSNTIGFGNKISLLFSIVYHTLWVVSPRVNDQQPNGDHYENHKEILIEIEEGDFSKKKILYLLCIRSLYRKNCKSKALGQIFWNFLYFSGFSWIPIQNKQHSQKWDSETKVSMKIPKSDKLTHSKITFSNPIPVQKWIPKDFEK